LEIEKHDLKNQKEAYQKESTRGLIFTLHLLVGICHSRGVVIAEEYEKLTGSWFAQLVYRTLQQVLIDCAMVKNKEHLLVVMDNDPSQRSSTANEALHESGADLVEIPTRSPDLNPIENIFHSVKRSLREGALRLIREDFQSSRQRILVLCYSAIYVL